MGYEDETFLKRITHFDDQRNLLGRLAQLDHRKGKSCNETMRANNLKKQDATVNLTLSWGEEERSVTL